MHELDLTMSMVDAISERIESMNGPRVKRIVVEIGALSAVLPDAIRFSFDLCSRGTVTEGAELEIREIPARGACRTCLHEVETRSAVALCECGSGDVAWRSGNELKIRELEVV